MSRLPACLAILAIGLLMVALPVRATEAVASLNPLRAIDKADLKAFVEAPLFNPTRRLPTILAPVAIPMAMPTETVEPPPNVHLLGLVQGAQDVALIRGPDNKTTMLSTGDSLGGWDVAVLPPNGLRLSKGRRAYDYAIFAATGAASGPVAVVPDPSAPGNTDAR